jgi:hypothetical protein
LLAATHAQDGGAVKLFHFYCLSKVTHPDMGPAARNCKMAHSTQGRPWPALAILREIWPDVAPSSGVDALKCSTVHESIPRDVQYCRGTNIAGYRARVKGDPLEYCANLMKDRQHNRLAGQECLKRKCRI